MSLADIVFRLRNWNAAHPRKPRVLMIDDWFPDPTIGAGAPRALQLLRVLSRSQFSVTHFSTLEAPNAKHVLLKSMPGVKLVKTSGNLSPLADYLRRNCNAFDAILISRPHNLEAFNNAVRDNPSFIGGKLTVYDAEAVFSQRDILRSAVLNEPMSSKQIQEAIQHELALADGFDIVLTVNEANATLFRSAGHSDVRVLRHAVPPCKGERPHSERRDILFVGPTYSDETPNTDSVIWFVDSVLPIIRTQMQRSIALTLAGKSNAAKVAARADGRIDQRGPLSDLSQVYHAARVFVAPTRFAAGIPLKVYEAAAHGVPCVITSLLASQLDWQHEREALVADTPQAFAQQTMRLYDNVELWERVRTAAFDRTLRDCSADHFEQTVATIFSGTAVKELRRKSW